MKTYLDCIPCFYRQALEAAKLAGADEIVQKKIIDELSKLIPDFPLEASPSRDGENCLRFGKGNNWREGPF